MKPPGHGQFRPRGHDWQEWKKGNKQCLFDTPRMVMVNKNNEKWLS